MGKVGSMDNGGGGGGLRSVLLGGWVAAMVALSPEAAEGQEFGFFLSQGEVAHQEFVDPSGFGAYLVLDALPNLRFRGAFTHYDASARRTGEVCIHFDPRYDCSMENLRSTSELEGVSLAVIPHFRPAEWVELGVGGGASFMHLGLEVEGETDRFVNIFKPTGGQTGAFVMGHLKFTPLARFPIVFTIQYQSQWVHFSGCSPDETTYDPYCGTTRMKELQVGLGYWAGR